MKRVVIILAIMFMLTGCEENSENYDDKVSKYTEETMLERWGDTSEDVTDGEEKKEEITDAVTTDNIVVTNEDNNKNEIDIDDADYKIHKGRIDCLNTSDCFQKAKKVQDELVNSIQDIMYLDVKNKRHQILGYFINYIFKDYQYDDYETCVSKGEYLKQILTDREVDYHCDDKVLKITLDKEEGNND